MMGVVTLTSFLKFKNEVSKEETRRRKRRNVIGRNVIGRNVIVWYLHFQSLETSSSRYWYIHQSYEHHE